MNSIEIIESIVIIHGQLKIPDIIARNRNESAISGSPIETIARKLQQFVNAGYREIWSIASSCFRDVCEENTAAARWLGEIGVWKLPAVKRSRQRSGYVSRKDDRLSLHAGLVCARASRIRVVLVRDYRLRRSVWTRVGYMVHTPSVS